MFRVALGIIVFLIVVATPVSAVTALDETASFGGIDGALMSLPAIVILTLHHMHRQRHAAR